MKMYRLKTWEIALLAALCVSLGVGLWARQTQQALAGKLVRLHVIANSDSDADQAEKLQIRDKVLALLSPLLAECDSRDDAVDIIQSNMTALESVGDVSVSLETEHYPTRDYASFSLPAGDYISLKVTLGEGTGRNWWCVVFPPLCTEALAQTDQDAFHDLTDDELGLITQDGETYLLRFRVIEWWDALTAGA